MAFYVCSVPEYPANDSDIHHAQFRIHHHAPDSSPVPYYRKAGKYQQFVILVLLVRLSAAAVQQLPASICFCALMAAFVADFSCFWRRRYSRPAAASLNATGAVDIPLHR